jgi:hypothetical protein
MRRGKIATGDFGVGFIACAIHGSAGMAFISVKLGSGTRNGERFHSRPAGTASLETKRRDSACRAHRRSA